MFQNRRSVVLLFAIKDILDPVCKLALKLQHRNAALCDVPDCLKTVQKQLDEIIVGKDDVTCAKDFTKDCGFALLQFKNEQ